MWARASHVTRHYPLRVVDDDDATLVTRDLTAPRSHIAGVLIVIGSRADRTLQVRLSRWVGASRIRCRRACRDGLARRPYFAGALVAMGGRVKSTLQACFSRSVTSAFPAPRRRRRRRYARQTGSVGTARGDRWHVCRELTHSIHNPLAVPTFCMDSSDPGRNLRPFRKKPTDDAPVAEYPDQLVSMSTTLIFLRKVVDMETFQLLIGAFGVLVLCLWVPYETVWLWFVKWSLDPMQKVSDYSRWDRYCWKICARIVQEQVKLKRKNDWMRWKKWVERRGMVVIKVQRTNGEWVWVSWCCTRGPGCKHYKR